MWLSELFKLWVINLDMYRVQCPKMEITRLHKTCRKLSTLFLLDIKGDITWQLPYLGNLFIKAVLINVYLSLNLQDSLGQNKLFAGIMSFS